MWPWTRREPAEDTLRTRVGDLESEVRRLRVEWKDTLDRLLRLDDRQRKREERSEAPTHAPVSHRDRKAALWSRMRSGNGTS